MTFPQIGYNIVLTHSFQNYLLLLSRSSRSLQKRIQTILLIDGRFPGQTAQKQKKLPQTAAKQFNAEMQSQILMVLEPKRMIEALEYRTLSIGGI